MSHQEFIAHAQKHGFARPNRFRVIIPIPDALQPQSTNMVEKKSNIRKLFDEVLTVVRIFIGPGKTSFTRGLDLMCSQTELPGKTINVSESKYNGDVHKIGHSILYGNQQFVFKVSSDMHEKTIIDEWMKLVIDPTTHEVGYYKDYVSNITIIQLDENGNAMHSIVLEDAWPVMTNPLTLSNQDSNTIHELMAQFAYKRWYPAEDEEAGSPIDSLLKTPLGPFVSPFLSNPLVQRGLDYVKNATGLDLEGEALGIYKQIDTVVKNTTGQSTNKTVSILNNIAGNLSNNRHISNQQADGLIGLIEGTVRELKGG